MNTHAQAERQVWLAFWIHLAVFVLVTAGLAALNLSRSPDQLWFHYIAVGWGLGVVMHGFNCLTAHRFEKQVHHIERTGRP